MSSQEWSSPLIAVECYFVRSLFQTGENEGDAPSLVLLQGLTGGDRIIALQNLIGLENKEKEAMDKLLVG